MSKRFVVEKLVCENCFHYRVQDKVGYLVGFCEFHDKFAYRHDPFCLAFDGQPLLQVTRKPRTLIDTGRSYRVV